MKDPSPPAAAIAIGASAGAVDALMRVLPAIPQTFRDPILVVVHIPPDKENLLPGLFAQRCHLEVKEAEDKEPVRNGTIYFAPADYHLLVGPDFHFELSSEEPVLFSRPAIDVLFESAADAWGGNLTGVVLTGASCDGAAGLAAVAEAGGRALVQDPDEAESPVMPAAAIKACPLAERLTLAELARTLSQPFRD